MQLFKTTEADAEQTFFYFVTLSNWPMLKLVSMCPFPKWLHRFLDRTNAVRFAGAIWTFGRWSTTGRIRCHWSWSTRKARYCCWSLCTKPRQTRSTRRRSTSANFGKNTSVFLDVKLWLRMRCFHFALCYVSAGEFFIAFCFLLMKVGAVPYVLLKHLAQKEHVTCTNLFLTSLVQILKCILRATMWLAQ